MAKAKMCSLITTRVSDERLEEIFMSEDNSMGPMGSGGYSIRLERAKPGGASKLVFSELDCAPASSYPAFIKDGKIWATHIKDFVLQTLSNEGLRFTHKQVETPSFIIEHLKKAA